MWSILPEQVFLLRAPDCPIHRIFDLMPEQELEPTTTDDPGRILNPFTIISLTQSRLHHEPDVHDFMMLRCSRFRYFLETPVFDPCLPFTRPPLVVFVVTMDTVPFPAWTLCLPCRQDGLSVWAAQLAGVSRGPSDMSGVGGCEGGSS